ncbi:MAG: phosphate starvation-inducible protein PhoH [Treponema sp.]|nr:MAG: phosphate starvation-inducible protein PhoH [Treponema sp.]
MDEAYTIVLEDSDVLSALCGANDKNLRMFEQYLGVPVVSRGNEMTVLSSDSNVCEKFQDLISKASKSPEIKSGSSDDFLNSLVANLQDCGDGLPVEDGRIVIPRSGKSVYPKNAKQAEFVVKIKKFDLTFGVGPAGTGKTFLATAVALQMLLNRKVKKIVLTRPVVEAGENLGFLPGDLTQKITPYLRPLYDIIEYLLPVNLVRNMEDSGLFEIAPLAYMRGRTLHNSVVILDEAQNTTKEQMKMFLTRMGENSKLIVTGDPGQSDIGLSKTSGLEHAVSILRPISQIGIVEFTSKDVVRHSLVQKIINAYEKK